MGRVYVQCAKWGSDFGFTPVFNRGQDAKKVYHFTEAMGAQVGAQITQIDIIHLNLALNLAFISLCVPKVTDTIRFSWKLKTKTGAFFGQCMGRVHVQCAKWCWDIREAHVFNQGKMQKRFTSSRNQGGAQIGAQITQIRKIHLNLALNLTFISLCVPKVTDTIRFFENRKLKLMLVLNTVWVGYTFHAQSGALNLD